MDLFVAIAEFKAHLKAAGYAERTIVSYQRNLKQFERYLQGRSLSDLRKVTSQVVFDYQHQVMSEPIALESKALKIRPVKRLFEYLTDTHRLLINPTEGGADYMLNAVPTRDLPELPFSTGRKRFWKE